MRLCTYVGLTHKMRVRPGISNKTGVNASEIEARNANLPGATGIMVTAARAVNNGTGGVSDGIKSFFTTPK